MPNVKPDQGVLTPEPECLPITDRGVSYGHGVFETLRVYKGELPLLKGHLDRLRRGCQILRIPFPEQRVLQALDYQLQKIQGESGVIKLIITAGRADRGYRMPGSLNPKVLGQAYNFAAVDTAKQKKGFSLYLCNYQLPLNPHLAGIKHLNRLDQVLAAIELDGQDCDDALLCDARGNIIEALSRNVFIKKGQRWLTPNLNFCGVDGVMRRYLLEAVFPHCGIPVSVEEIPLNRLADCREMFICNAVTGISPVASICGTVSWQGTPGEDSLTLVKALGELQPCFRV